MITTMDGMIGIVIGRYMYGIDWTRGWSRVYFFKYDMYADDDVWTSLK